MRRLALSVAAAVVLLVATEYSSAAIITEPTDLNPGDQYRLAFLTYRNYSASFIPQFDNFVSDAANASPPLAALGTTWKSISGNARDKTGTNPLLSVGVPIYNLRDRRLADNNADLWDGSLYSSIDTGENGISYFQQEVWTGTDTDGTAYTSIPSKISIGNSGARGFTWINAQEAIINSGTRRLYGMSGILTIVPEPSTLLLTAIGLLGLVACGRHRSKPQ